MKKILLIYHSNIFNSTCGTNIRLLGIARMLAAMGYKFDQFVPKSFENDWSVIDHNIIDTIYIEEKRDINNVLARFIRRLLNKIRKMRNGHKSGFDWIESDQRNRFRQVVSSTQYDFVLFSYIFYASLINELPEGTKKVLLLEDFATVQEYQDSHDKLGVMFEDEIHSIDKFDSAICISMDEMFLFDSLVDRVKLFYIPHFIEKSSMHSGESKNDILFIASDNKHNKRGIKWFLDRVYPLIERENFVITIIGKIVDTIPKERYPSIVFVKHIESTGDIYNQTKMAISPLFSGTGLKIKIVEAMSYGVPVVCTSRSMVGFPNKLHNGCLIADDPAEFASNIIRIAGDRELRDKLSIEGLMQYDEYFNPEYAKKNLSKIFGISENDKDRVWRGMGE